jgi:hypothetical protein
MFNEKPRKRKKVMYGPERPPYKDPFSPIERWFSLLPCRWLERECHCGSGKPILYWNREEGSGCDDCTGFFHISIVEATVWNFCEKFQLSPEVEKEISDKLKKMRE